MTSKWVSVGRVRDAHGLRGEIFVALKAKVADWLETLQVFRLITPANLEQEFLVMAAREHKDGLIVTLNQVENRTQAEALRGSRVEIPAEYLVAEEEDESLFLGQFLGLEVSDERLGRLGLVVGLGSNGPQDLLVIETARGRFDVPLVEDFICELNLDKKYLKMDLPEGLIEV